jgi:hypothetical protein
MSEIKQRTPKKRVERFPSTHLPRQVASSPSEAVGVSQTHATTTQTNTIDFDLGFRSGNTAGLSRAGGDDVSATGRHPTDDGSRENGGELAESRPEANRDGDQPLGEGNPRGPDEGRVDATLDAARAPGGTHNMGVNAQQAQGVTQPPPHVPGEHAEGVNRPARTTRRPTRLANNGWDEPPLQDPPPPNLSPDAPARQLSPHGSAGSPFPIPTPAVACTIPGTHPASTYSPTYARPPAPTTRTRTPTCTAAPTAPCAAATTSWTGTGHGRFRVHPAASVPRSLPVHKWWGEKNT